MADKKAKFSFKKLFFMKSFFGSLVGKTKLEDKPLNWLSILFLIIFDIFIFTNLIDGLDNSSKNIINPSVKYSYNCSNLFNYDANKNFDYNMLVYISDDYKSSYRNEDSSELCKTLDSIVSKVASNSSLKNDIKNLSDLYEDKRDFEKAKREYEKEYNEFRKDYSSGLGDFENRISNIDDRSIRDTYEKILGKIDSIESEIQILENRINSDSNIKAIKKYTLENKDIFISEKNNYTFWYPVYVTGMESLLIFPILILSIFLYKFALKRNKKILLILSSNLALISGFFAFIILFKVIYWIMPKKFLANILTYLASIKALAVWNYILTIFGIILFGLLMYLSQKSIEKYSKIKEERRKEIEKLNFKRVSKERYWNKMCIECNTKLLDGASHCSNCGTDQYKHCSNCRNRMPKAYSHCEKCGTKN